MHRKAEANVISEADAAGARRVGSQEKFERLDERTVRIRCLTVASVAPVVCGWLSPLSEHVAVAAGSLLV